MRSIHILILCAFICVSFGNQLKAQTCGPEPVIESTSYEGTAFFNYGSTARSKSNSYKTSFAVGQTLVGYTEGIQYNTSLGFYSRFFLPPFALKVNATQGDLLDRIQISWAIDALGPSPSGGFNIYRNGTFQGHVDPEIRNFDDFNVIAGRPYTYTVRGVNIFGEGIASDAIGFEVPNGVVTGSISTPSGSAVPDATVTLTPMQGFSAYFGDGDAAITMQEPGTDPFLPDLDSNWTITFWVQTDFTSPNAGKILSMDSLNIRARPSPNGGISIAKTASGTGSTPFIFADFKPNTQNDWHHIALSYDRNGKTYRLYFEGILVKIATSNPVPPPDTINFGALAGPGSWNGRLDELRFYNHTLDELDFDHVMGSTAAANTPYLTHYWKMDEELGVKSYDIVKRQKLYFCGADFDPDRPPVHTAGMTDEDGFYKIEGISYGDGTTFTATPNKNFYLHRSLKFEKADGDYATLPDFPITPQATIETWVNSAAVDGFQSILSKKWGTNEFRLMLSPSGTDYQIRVYLNTTVHDFGLLGSGFQHLAITWDSTSHIVAAYKNGVSLGTFAFPAITGNWSDTDPAKTWYLGKLSDETIPFGGLIDEIAFYNSILSPATILSHFQNERDIQESGLRVYFPLDEGSGNKISNVGSLLLNGGTTFGIDWSAFAAHQVITPHVFERSSEHVTLNSSVTSVDQVHFSDKSTIVVTGYVRYKDTDCFANNVEILVNDVSFTPKIVTDSTGKFVIDFDPGATAKLTPKFEDHVFTPAFWQITNLSSPIAGILFTDITTHKITGKVKGGEPGVCEKNITPPSAQCIVQVTSANGCLKRSVTVNDAGTFTFNNLPPLEKMQIAIIKHNDPAIKLDFDNQGGYVVDISKKDTVVNFFYVAPPEVEVTGLHNVTPFCDQIVMEQFDHINLDIKLKEHYYGGVCEIDTAKFEIINGFGDEVKDTVMGNKLLEYNFVVGPPNPSPPHNKTLQIIGTKIDDDVEASLTISAVVLGIKSHENTFTTLLPEIPSLILRDPPGDESYSYLEKNEKFCTSTSVIDELETEGGGALKLFVGGKNEWIIAPLGLGVIIDIAGDSHIETGASVTYQRTSNSSYETCTSFDTRISTNSDDLIVGGEQGADLYMGTAINIVYGNVDIIAFDTMHCEGTLDDGFEVQPGDFATTFIYSEFYILGTLIPSLELLKTDPQTSDEDSLRYAESIARWDSIIALNHRQKENARILKNISFDAGVEYEYAETSDTTSTAEIEETLANEFHLATEWKITVLEVGIGGDARFVTTTTSGGKNESGKSQGVTVGYALKDNDPLDAFSIDVGMDSLYKTPVFDIKAGQSSCPWEPGTANREGTNLAMFPGFSQTVLNVPANEAATFKFNLGNTSATHEAWYYSIFAPPENNPNGAVIKLNGAVLTSPVEFPVLYGTSQPVTITVNRGPIEYNYDDLLVAEISVCEYERHVALAIPVDDDPNFFSGLDLSVHFIRPCSEVNITSPRQNWVVFPDPETGPEIDDDLVQIVVSGYDTLPVTFQSIRVQYRAADGNGAWLPVSELFNPHWEHIEQADPRLGDRYSIIDWDTDMLEDGDYEIRALTVCGNTIPNENGYSEIIKGRIDRQPPGIVGLPQPSDRVFQVGDEISFTFNQDINCDKLIAATIGAPNNVGLYDVSDGNKLLNFNISCVGNKLVIVPTDQNHFIENHLLRAEVRGIQDLTGNEFIYNENMFNHGKWEFYVDRNELAWLTDSAGITKYEDETKSTTIKIHNRGGYSVDFTIEQVPDWVHVTPDAGTLVPNEIRDIEFTAADTLSLGWLHNSVTLHTAASSFMGGDELLPLDVRTICRPPDWNVDPSQYQMTMTLITRLSFNGGVSPSTDPEDIVAAFIDGEVRGMAKLVHNTAVNNYVAYLTIYGNNEDVGKPVTYEIFDASACARYEGKFTNTPFNFSSNGTQGSPTNSRLLSNGSLVDDIPLNKGWNWISFNLHFPDSTINNALEQVSNPDGDLIKDQFTFSVFNHNTWSGSLPALSDTSMYMYQANQPNTIRMTGTALPPASNPIHVASGWNWIGYIPTYKLSVNAALASLPAVAGDIIKSQTAFAQYVSSGAGWVGNLQKMQPLQGYQLRMTNAGTLTYPPSGFTGDIPLHSRDAESVSTFWKVNAAQYENTMTLIGMFQFDETNATTAEMELGAFAGDEIRGAVHAVYIEYLNAYMFFMTCYANESGEQIHFKLFDGVTGEIQNLAEKITFIPNGNNGSIESPVPFTLQTTGLGDVQSELSFNVQPNPFKDETICRIELPKAQHVRIWVTDMEGRRLYYKPFQANAGMNAFKWKGCTTTGIPLSNGVYFIRIETEEGVLTKKVMLQR